MAGFHKQLFHLVVNCSNFFLNLTQLNANDRTIGKLPKQLSSSVFQACMSLLYKL